MVPRVHVGVRLGEVGDRPVERVARPEVGGDRDRVAGPGVGPGERPAADPGVEAEAEGLEGRDVHRALHVPQLAQVVVAATGPARPPQEHVRGGLHELLTDHDALTLVGVGGDLEVGFEDGRRGLLGLEDQRVVLVAAFEDEDEAARPHAADPDHLEGDVDEAVALQEIAPVLRHGRPVIGEDLLEGRHTANLLEVHVGDHGGVVEEDATAVDDAGERLEGAHPITLAGLAEDRLESLAATGGGPARECAGGLGRVADVPVGDRRVEHLDEPHPGVAGHPLPVAPNPAHRRGPDDVRAEAVGPPGDGDAGGEALHVPLPRSGQRLVEVVRVEDEGPLGRGEQAEVGQVGVTAGLDDDVGPRGRRRGRTP